MFIRNTYSIIQSEGFSRGGDYLLERFHNAIF